MIEMKRRSFLLGMAGLIAMPAVIRVADLMPVKKIIMPPVFLPVFDNNLAYWMDFQEDVRAEVRAITGISHIAPTRIISAADGVLPWHA